MVRAAAACSLLLAALTCWTVPVSAESSMPGSGSHLRSLEKMEADEHDPDRVWSSPHKSSGTRGVGTTAGVKSSPSGYNPERIKRFWSHYHPTSREPKSRPLEREK